MIKTAVIMAGGGGTRFWPVSRMSTPKQLAKLTGDDVMINETIKHYEGVVGRENTFIVTNEKQAKLMNEVLYSEVARDHILIEPVQRNTAPCIIYAAMTLTKLYGDALMAVLPADHHIANMKEYERILELAFDTAEKTNRIVTIGIKPTFASTGYGYINFSREAIEGESEVHKLLKFVEKPAEDIAKGYVESGEYLWNSGMFIWKASVIIDEFKKYLPNTYKLMEGIYDKLRTDDEAKAIEATYPELDKISIDYGIMETAEGVLCIPGEFGWNDVGSWDALDDVFDKDDDGNVVVGKHIGVDTKNTVVFNKGEGSKLVTTIGVEGLVIVQTEDTIMVLDKSKAQDVKLMVDKLKELGCEDLL